MRWTYSYEDALRMAAREEKPIIAGFYTKWCTWCRKLDEVTYVDPAVVSASREYVCLKVDAEANRNIAYMYGVGKMPTILFLDPSGRVIWKEFGYRDPAFLAKRMHEVLDFYRVNAVANSFIRKAFDQANGGNVDAALSTMAEAITKYPDDARLYAARSVIYRFRDDIDNALSDMNKSLSLNPEDDSVLVMRGALFQQMRQSAKAMDDFNKAIAINKWAYEAYNGRGIIYMEEKNIDAAIKNFNSTILINPRHAAAYFNRGIAYAYAGMLDKSINDFTSAIRLKPDMLGAYSNRAIAYLYIKQFDKCWEDVHALEKMGGGMTSEFMAELKRLSGRDN